MKLFTFARLRLTASYALGLTLLSLFFSLGIYRVQTAELTRFEAAQRHRLEMHLQERGFVVPGRLAQLVFDDELISETKHRLLFRLGVINGIVMLLSTLLGYFLSGATLAPIEQMVKKQQQFVGDASHELRTPLTAMRTSLEVFLRGSRRSLAQASQLAKDSLADVKRLERLTTSLLTLSRPESSRTHSPTSLNSVIALVVKQFRPIAGTKRIKLTSRLSKGLVVGDPEELRELFTILLDNAVKYTGKGGQVTVSLKQSGRHLVAAVSDTGIGISSQDLPHIFNRFYRADIARSQSGEGGGYGLGLAIAKQIAAAHHAKLEVVSKLGEGTTFQLTFRSV